MPTMIETVFENGVFRPLKPVSIPENQRVKIRIEEGDGAELHAPPRPRLRPSEYPDDFPDVPDAERDSVPVPPKAVATVRATFVAAGKLTPTPYPED